MSDEKKLTPGPLEPQYFPQNINMYHGHNKRSEPIKIKPA